MRTTQYRGFTPAAMKWLNQHCKKVEYTELVMRVYPEEKIPVRYISELKYQETGNLVRGLFNEEVRNLREYQLMNGNGSVEEYLQAEPWSSGPCIFLALRFTDSKKPVKQSLWHQEEIDKA